MNGPVATLKARVIHDDWKPTEQWLVGQARYMEREFEWLRVRKGGLVRWLRLTPPLMPIAVFLYCLFGKGPHSQWPRGNFLRASTYGRRGCAVPHGAGSKVARSRQRTSSPERPRNMSTIVS